MRRPWVFAVDTDPARPRTSGRRLADVQEVLDLDLWEGMSEARTELPGHSEPLFLVCTHGRHDPCCAERGRPLARALSVAYPGETWECSHMGGDRFAGNLMCLPHGVVYGRVAPDDAVPIATDYLRGRLDLAHLRGRGSYPFAIQAAEWHLRTSLGLTGLDDLVLTGDHVADHDVTAVFENPSGATWSVRLRVGRAPARPLTCHATQPFAAPQFQLLKIDRL